MTQIPVLGNAKRDPKCQRSLVCVDFFFFFCLLNIVSGLFGLPEGKRRRIGYTRHGDINIFGIMLLAV